MKFAAGVSVERLRRPRIPDAYNPAATVPGDWADASTEAIEGAYVAATSSTSTTDPVRSQVVTLKSLYCSPTADVRPGDRIVSGSHTYEVDAVPEADVNPFTGWQPVQEIPLREALG